MRRIITRLYDKKIDGTGLAIFRITFTLVMLADVIQLFYFRHLVFDPIPYLVPNELHMWPILLIWIIALVFLIFGFYTRIATIVNYIITVAIFGSVTTFEYHMFYAYLTISFLFMFLPISQTISIDRLRKKLKYSNTTFHYSPTKDVPVLAYYVPIVLSLALVYFDSVFYKTASYLWTHGLGMWLPASMPQAVYLKITPFLNLKYVMLGLGYLTILFEALFLFTFFRKKWRVPILIIGVGLHLGILICFPIPLFALGVITVYMLLIPQHWWKKIFRRKEEQKTFVKFYYDGECPLCNRTKILLDHFNSRGRIQFLTVQGYAEKEPVLKDIPYEDLLMDIYGVDKKGKLYKGLDTYIRIFRTTWYLFPLAIILKIPGIYHLGKKVYKFVAENRYTERCTEENCGYTPPPVLPEDNKEMKIFTNFTLKDIKMFGISIGLGFIFLCQVLITYNSLAITKLQEEIGIENTAVVQGLTKVSNGVNYVMRIFLGETMHAVFMDAHFDDYQDLISVYYVNKNGNEELLPITTPSGTPGWWQSGFTWVNWTFRVNAPQINRAELLEGLRNYTAFWAFKNGVSLEEATFTVKIKKVKVPKKWERDFLNKQLSNPWIDAGKIVWKNKRCIPDVKIIEEM